MPTIQGPLNVNSFAATNCWGQSPLLLKQAIDANSLPSWQDVLELASEEESSITSRLISHVPGTLDTFRLEFGPFSEAELVDFVNDDDDVSSSSTDDSVSSSNTVSTLVLNDVDRWIPSLSDWMDQHFGFLPRWRRDDAQVSLARKGGGIGPHVDNYDVFLIQASGTRTWKIGLKTISTKEEYDHLVAASQVRILDLPDMEFTTVELGPGDCLYLPPRVVHWGSSTSQDCMTLSVGCRAPSALELLQRVTESLVDSVSPKATARYTDVEDIQQWCSTKSGNYKDLDRKVKDKMKRLVLDLVEEQLEDDAIWDRLLGELVTEPNRPMEDYPTPLSEMDGDWKNELAVWADAEKALETVLEDGRGVLRRAEGISFAWSKLDGRDDFTMFAQGRSFSIKDDSGSAPLLLDMIANGAVPLCRQQMIDQNIEVSVPMKGLLRDLLEEGLLYGDDEAETEDDDE